jgi:phospholipid N-methyltransferase
MDSEPNSRNLPAGWTFFRQWLKNPLRVAAISPSSRQLARQMMTQLPRNCRRVIELGGGTGVFTQALIDHGIEAAELLVLELNEELHQHLVRQFPHAKVVCGDAGNLRAIAEEHGFGGERKADAIISGLGLLSMPRQLQQSILQAAFDAMLSWSR